MVDVSNEELLAQLGVEVTQEKKSKLTPREERIIAGFEEIQRFHDEHNRSPMHGEERDIFERMYATRLDQIRKSDECLELVRELDHQGLLANANQISEPSAEYNSDEELLAELGIEAPKEGDITQLKHVRSSAEKKPRTSRRLASPTSTKWVSSPLLRKAKGAKLWRWASSCT